MATDPSSCYFQLSLSNLNIENASQSEESTASNMKLILEDEELDLNEQIYMKSLAAEICLENFSLSNLPSTFSGLEPIDMLLTTPSTLIKGNAIIDETTIKRRNESLCPLPLPALITSSPRNCLNHVNQSIRNSTNKYLLFRFLETVLDTDLFKESVFREPHIGNISQEDILLMYWYLRVAIITRLQLIAVINLKLQSNDEMPSPKGVPTAKYTEDEVTTAVNSSPLFKPLRKRKAVRHRLISPKRFYDTDLGQGVQPVLKQVADDLDKYLTDMGFEVIKDGALTTESNNLLTTIKNNNISLLSQAETCYNLLRLELQKQNSADKQGLHELYKNEILLLSLDPLGKCVFNTYPDLFLALDGSQFTLTFGPKTSKVLGVVTNASDEESLQIGPLTNSDSHATHLNRTTLKRNRILTQNDRLFARVTPMNRTLFVLTDMISNDCHYISTWKTNTEFSSYQILAAFEITQDDIESDCVLKLSQPRRFFRVKQAQNVLRSVNIVLADQYFRQLSFIPKTYCHFSLCLRPANLNI